MKTTCCLFAIIAGLATSLVAGRAAAVDIETEKAAIQAVIEEEKNAYVALDEARMAATWVQQPTSLKLYVFDGRETRFDGSTAIAAHDRANLARERLTAAAQRWHFEFSNYRITLRGDSAWVVFNAKLDGVAEGTPIAVTQSRVCVLQKEDGRWRIALMAITQLASERAGARLHPVCVKRRDVGHVPPDK